MNSKKSLITGLMLLVCWMRMTGAGADPQAILKVLPTEESLGSEWKRHVGLLFDPHSTPTEIISIASPLPESFRSEQRHGVANPQSKVSGWSNVHYTLQMTNGPAVYEVQIYRYRDRQRLAEEFDQILRLESEQYHHSAVKGLGDAAVFVRNTQGPGSTVWFRRADFKVWMGPGPSVTNWDQDVNLQHLAIEMDKRIVQMTGNAAVPVNSESARNKP
jgi:hypothetical protein